MDSEGHLGQSQSAPQEGQMQSKDTDREKEGKGRSIGKVRSHPNGDRQRPGGGERLGKGELQRQRKGKTSDLEGEGAYSSGSHQSHLEQFT